MCCYVTEPDPSRVPTLTPRPLPVTQRTTDICVCPLTCSEIRFIPHLQAFWELIPNQDLREALQRGAYLPGLDTDQTEQRPQTEV